MPRLLSPSQHSHLQVASDLPYPSFYIQTLSLSFRLFLTLGTSTTTTLIHGIIARAKQPFPSSSPWFCSFCIYLSLSKIHNSVYLVHC